jgi:hypothetical protein
MFIKATSCIVLYVSEEKEQKLSYSILSRKEDLPNLLFLLLFLVFLSM